MNNEKLQELLKNAETPFGNELIDVLEEDFDAEIVKEDTEYSDRGFFSETILKVEDVYVRVIQRYTNVGYRDYNFSAAFAQIVERREEIVTQTVVAYV